MGGPVAAAPARAEPDQKSGPTTLGLDARLVAADDGGRGEQKLLEIGRGLFMSLNLARRSFVPKTSSIWVLLAGLGLGLMSIFATSAPASAHPDFFNVFVSSAGYNISPGTRLYTCAVCHKGDPEPDYPARGTTTGDFRTSKLLVGGRADR